MEEVAFFCELRLKTIRTIAKTLGLTNYSIQRFWANWGFGVLYISNINYYNNPYKVDFNEYINHK